MNALRLATLSVLLMAGPALAGGPIAVADDPMPGSAEAAIIDWSGPYVGLSYGRIGGEATDPSIYDFENGTQLGLMIGYNLQRGSFVYGGELSYASVSGLVVANAGDDDIVDSVLELRGRLGYAVGKALIYGTLGYAKGKMTVNGTSGFGLSGTTYGVGLDYQLSQRTFVGLEYNRRNMDGSDPFELGTSTNAVSLRIGLSF